jgi:hypothetical protein
LDAINPSRLNRARRGVDYALGNGGMLNLIGAIFIAGTVLAAMFIEGQLLRGAVVVILAFIVNILGFIEGDINACDRVPRDD